MHLDWNINGDAYAEIGGPDILREAVEDALAVLPREHLRQLAAIRVWDRDPRGKALGIWCQDKHRVSIEIYARPHITPLLDLSPPVRDFALRLYLAYTLFHEVGHHVTRFLNRRAAPPRKAAVVEQKIERWADEYAEKRVSKLIVFWLQPTGRVTQTNSGGAMIAALYALNLSKIVSLEMESETEQETENAPGTNPAGASSEETR